ncbi:MAG TPA: thioredoxin family protein [Schlesneria sp.]
MLRATFGFVICWAMATAYSSAYAGEFNQVLSIGDVAPVWADLPGTDGKTHSLTDYKNREVLVLIFTCTSCAASVDYEDRINDLTKKYGGKDGKVAVVAACVNRVKEDTLPELTERAKKREFAFDYVYDESQKIAKDYGAIFTPEFYVFDRDRKLVYMGALDDVSDATKVKKRHVEAAIEATLKGEAPELKETIARGCRVRIVRERR